MFFGRHSPCHCVGAAPSLHNRISVGKGENNQTRRPQQRGLQEGRVPGPEHPSAILSNNFPFPFHAHDHLFHVYIPIRLFFLEIFRKKILYHRSASFIIFFPNACYSMLKICFIFYIFNSFIHITLFFWPCGMWDFSSSIRDQTHAPCRRSVES